MPTLKTNRRWTTPTLTVTPLLAMLMLITAGCSDQQSSDTQQTRSSETAIAEVAEVAEVAAIKVSDPETIAAGKQLFDQNCSVCHQPDAIGKPGFAPSLANEEFLSISTDKFLAGTIRDGRVNTGMPPFAHLGREKVEAIVAYLRSLAVLPDRSVQVNAQPEAHGDPRLGKQWYESICSTCHGIKGDGYFAGGTGTAIGMPGFLSKVSDGYIRTTVKEGRSNTRMLGFQGASGLANLSDREIDDIIVYLRTLQNL